MVDNRYATALVIGSVLSLLATVYLSVAVGTQHWYQYSCPPVKREGSNASELREEFINGEFDEKTYSDTMFRLNGTLGLWWRCILVPSQSHWFKEPDPKMERQCVSFTLPQQFSPKYKYPGNHNGEEDVLRTCEFTLLPL
ncbi:claudin domain-containing protein 1b [Cottoperca gobio]|uniref:Claudin domain-containing protein 1-like n=1 Tax=Cottoperca gobio TaxID=56716 RepID=A0A6J2PZ90_COTGO|nr:claudin domain-containing protein 1-like [Cottoperca gobio]XP_029290821.1 claudin domain-containing protein 1-like [Cottoperca gobio]